MVSQSICLRRNLHLSKKMTCKVAYSHKANGIHHGDQIRTQSRSDWPQMEFLNSDSLDFGSPSQNVLNLI